MRITLNAKTVIEDISIGASIAVNGCCLTVTEYDETSWSADAVPETMSRTNLGTLTHGSSQLRATTQVGRALRGTRYKDT